MFDVSERVSLREPVIYTAFRPLSYVVVKGKEIPLGVWERYVNEYKVGGLLAHVHIKKIDDGTGTLKVVELTYPRFVKGWTRAYVIAFKEQFGQQPEPVPSFATV